MDERPPQQENAGGRILQLDLMRALQMHRRLIWLMSLVGIVAAGISFVRVWPVYKAQSQVYIQPAAPKVLEKVGSSRWGADANSYESLIQQQVQGVMQPEVLTRTLRRLPNGLWQKNVESDASAVDRLQKALKAERIGESYQIGITAQANNPDLAALLANTVAASLIENVARQEKAGNSERIAMLQEERDRIQKELEADRSEQESLSKQLGMVAVSGEVSNAYEHETNALREELVKARAQHDEAAAQLQTLSRSNGNTRSLDALADEASANDAGLNSMKATLDQRRAQLVTQMANLTPSHPLYKQDSAELAQIDASLEAAQKELRRQVGGRIEQKLHSDLERTAQVEEKLNSQLAQLAGTAVGATPKMQRAGDLATNITRLQNRFTAVDDELHNMLLENNAPGAAFLSAAAIAPTHPAWGGVLRKTVPLALGGVFAGLILAIVLHRLDGRIWVASDVERELGYGPMVQLPDLEEVSPAVAEEHFFRLSATLEHAHQQGSLRSCVFTGAGQSVGVSMLAGQVRKTLAAMGRNAMMVDTSSMPQASSAAEAIDESGSKSLALQRGNRSSALLQRFSDESEEKTDELILTDTAPLLYSAETEYLARFVDAVVVVVESGVTTRRQLRSVAGSLQKLEVKAAGFVLNRIRLNKADPLFRQMIEEMERRQKTQAYRAKEKKSAAADQSNIFASVAESRAHLPITTPREEAVAAMSAESSRIAPDSAVASEKVASAESEQEAAERTARRKNEREELAYRYQKALDEREVTVPVVNQVSNSPVMQPQVQADAVPGYSSEGVFLQDAPLSAQTAEDGSTVKREEEPVAEAKTSEALRNPVVVSFARTGPEPTAQSVAETLWAEMPQRREKVVEPPMLRRRAEEEVWRPRPKLGAEIWPPVPAKIVAGTTEKRPQSAEVGEVLAVVRGTEDRARESAKIFAPPSMRPWQEEEDEILLLPFRRGQYQRSRKP